MTVLSVKYCISLFYTDFLCFQLSKSQEYKKDVENAKKNADAALKQSMKVGICPHIP